ncbi:MAG TPA: hypothetical protein VGS21_08920, partial [Acidimicrobiales bacterium]|nr:hypothetical protein [Acidimicrobiales bacterium]
MTAGRPPVGDGYVLMADRLATPTDIERRCWIAVEAGRIVGVGSSDEHAPHDGLPVVDLADVILAPGFVDLHVHGGDGDDVNAWGRTGPGGDPGSSGGASSSLTSFHAAHGTTALLATTISDSLSSLGAVAATVADRSEDENGAAVLGSHLEGPWLAKGRAGAQP